VTDQTRFGVFLLQIYPWPQIKAEAAGIETLGFDSLWIADHFVSPYEPTADWFECWSLLGALAASTSRLRGCDTCGEKSSRRPWSRLLFWRQD
jgi:alkanesulfonate monooxygenase SsuD/methylene tetrahydromethanopterin reductase-like flavin-dependent oxidoreductase (luciferase family)